MDFLIHTKVEITLGGVGGEQNFLRVFNFHLFVPNVLPMPHFLLDGTRTRVSLYHSNVTKHITQVSQGAPLLCASFNVCILRLDAQKLPFTHEIPARTSVSPYVAPQNLSLTTMASVV